MTPDDATLLKSISDGVQEARAETDRTWGVDRLRLLVDEETRIKFDRQADKYGQALEAAWGSGERPLTAIAIAELQEAAKRMRTALRVCDRQARESGCTGLSEAVWEIPLHDGTVAAFCRDTASAVAVRAEGRYVTIWTPQEVANVIDALPSLLSEAKEAFPGARVVAPANRVARFVPEKELPF